RCCSLLFRDNIQGYISAAAVQYNQGNLGYRPQGVANQMQPPGFAQSNVQNNKNRFGPPQGFNRGNNFNPEHSYQGPAQQNQNGKLKAITTRSGLVTDEPTVPTPPTSINPEVDEHVEETFTDPDLTEYTIKVPPPFVPKCKPPSQREFVVHQRDPLYPNIPYPLRMFKQKQQKKDEVQIQNFWQMFKQLHVNITLADALILMPKYQKMLKALLSNKEKLQELANTPLNENCSAVILKKLPKKLGDPGKFLIPCGFSELKCKALADLADFVIVDYESDPRVPLILGRPFLRIARALIDVHGEEMILRNSDERLTLNMKHDTASYSNHPQRESANLINSFNVSIEHFHEVSVSNQQSGNPALSLYQEFTLLEVTHEIHNSEGCNLLSEILLDIDAFNNIHPYFDDDPLSGSTTYSAN
nr:reverse transcriptase domain-containing protein [Tanacetum cinerariifolium]